MKSLQNRLITLRNRLWLAVLIVAMSLGWGATFVRAASLSSASVTLSDSRPSQTANYNLKASSVTTSAIKCVKAVFATTVSGNTKPSGMVTATGITLDASTDYVPTPAGWTRGGSDPDGTITFTNASGETPASSSSRHWVLDGLSNGNTVDTNYYLRFSTYNNTDCVSNGVDNVNLTFIFTTGQTLSLTVDPTLSFTVNSVAASQGCNGATSTQASSSSTIPFGTVSLAANSIVCQDLTVTTNAGSGYTVYIRYTGKPTSGGFQISDHTGSNASPTAFSSPGTEAYGYTTDDASLQAAAANRFISDLWAAATTTNAEVAYDAAPVSSQTTRVGHQVGISGTTRAGIYTTSVIYTATPVY
ncbi:MAG TPA: hypothetical protein VLF41_02320 [Candidatus Nanoarchaeia archaeon]|nr:hypothetical protein [Candidatus Nanoarchaeia archaeon]